MHRITFDEIEVGSIAQLQKFSSCKVLKFYKLEKASIAYTIESEFPSISSEALIVFTRFRFLD